VPDTIPRAVDASPRAARVIALDAGRRRRRAMPGKRRLALVDKVAAAAASDVVHGGLVLHHTSLALEFLVEAENGSLALAVHVASSAATSGEERVGRVGGDFGARGGAGGSLAGSDVFRIYLGDVASAAAAGVDVVRLRD